MFDRFIAYYARQTPQALAVTTLSSHQTYAELDATIDRVAAALSENALPPQGALVAVAVADHYSHWILLMALARLGIATASYMSVQRRQMEPLLRPDLVITDEAADDASRPRVLRVSADWFREIATRPATPIARPKVDPKSIARISTSSGTTGVPKKFALSWADVEHRLMQIGTTTNYLGVAEKRLLSLIGPEHVVFPGTALTAWGVGGTMIFGPDDPVALANALSRLNPTIAFMSPIQLKVLLDALPEGFRPMRELSVGVSGSHTPRAVRELARMRLTNNLMLLYASSETSSIAGRPDTDLTADDADVGWLTPWAEVEIVDENHVPVPFGTLGRIRVRGPGVASSYLDDDEANSKYFHDGWFYPADIGTLSADGRLRVEGRVGDVMNFGGAKFLPQVIESAVLACTGVRDAGAFSMPDKSGFEMPWIAIVRGPDVNESEISKALTIPGLPPAHVVWIEKIPRTPTGKVYRDQLQAAAQKLATA